MENTNKYVDKIEDYLNGILNEAEKNQFELELKNNQELATEYNLQMKVEKSLKNSKLIEFRSIIEDAHGKVSKTNKKPIVRSLFVKYAAAASIIVIIGFSLFYSLNTGKYTSKEVFAAYYEPFPAIGEPRSFGDNNENTNNNILYNEAINDYNNNKFSEAISKFTELIKNDEKNMAAHLYLGISYIGVKKYDSAMKSFKYIIKQEDVYYYQPAKWYLGLCKLLIGENIDAEKIFLEISNEDGVYNEQASKILKTIKKIK